MLAGIRDILIICTIEDLPVFQKVLEFGEQWGISIEYAVQDQPNGIAEAFVIGKEFIDNNQVCLILGDNLFHGKLDFLRNAIQTNVGGTVFGYKVQDPERYGVVEFDAHGKVISIEEKPTNPKSRYAIPGLYIFDANAPFIAEKVEPSERGEKEITEVQKAYLKNDKLRVELIGRGIAWLDTGTPDSLLEAGQFISVIEKRQNMKVACLEEIALDTGFISLEEFEKSLDRLPNSLYKDYCKKILLER